MSVERTENLEKMKFADLGGIKQILEDLKWKIDCCLYTVDLVKKLGVSSFCGIVIDGESGCGKTALGFAIANAYPTVYMVSPADLISGDSVEKLFYKAIEHKPSVIYIDGIDRIDDEHIILKLVSWVDHCASMVMCPIVVIGTISCVNSVHPKLVKRLKDRISLPVPDKQAREETFCAVKKKLSIDYSSIDLKKILIHTNGLVGADFVLTAKEAQILATKRGDKALTTSDFEELLSLLKPILFPRICLQGEDQVVLLGAKCYQKTLSPLHTELKALVWAMKSILSSRLMCQVFEIDCAELVSMVKSPEEWPSFSNQLDDFASLRTSLTDFMISRIPRSCNRQGDCLAQISRVLFSEFSFVSTTPPIWTTNCGVIF